MSCGGINTVYMMYDDHHILAKFHLRSPLPSEKILIHASATYFDYCYDILTGIPNKTQKHPKL